MNCPTCGDEWPTHGPAGQPWRQPNPAERIEHVPLGEGWEWPHAAHWLESRPPWELYYRQGAVA